jgi:hypothetical protein
MVKIVYNKLLGGWYIVRGPHQAPLSGRFDTKAQAQAYLKRKHQAPTLVSRYPAGAR